MALPNKIDVLRKKKGLSYREIAKRSGFSAQYIHLLAKNKRHNPSLEAMQKIAAALDESIERVFQINQRKERMLFNARPGDRIY